MDEMKSAIWRGGQTSALKFQFTCKMKRQAERKLKVLVKKKITVVLINRVLIVTELFCLYKIRLGICLFFYCMELSDSFLLLAVWNCKWILFLLSQIEMS